MFRLGAVLMVGAGLAGCKDTSRKPIDCDQIAHTRVPFEIQIKTGDKKISVQVYRSDQMFSTRFLRMDSGDVAKILVQGPFPISRSSNRETVKFNYNYLSTSQSILEHRPSFYDVTMSLDKDGKTENLPTGGRHLLTYEGVDSLSVGACVFQTLHYIDEKQGYPIRVRSEKWFSPDLEISLKEKSSIMDINTVKKTTSTEVVSIELDFEPLKYSP